MRSLIDRINAFVEDNSGGWIQIPQTDPEIADQCWECRISGTVVLLATSAAAGRYFLLAKQHDLGNRVFFGGMSSIFGAMGIYRAVTPTKPVHMQQRARLDGAYLDGIAPVTTSGALVPFHPQTSGSAFSNIRKLIRSWGNGRNTNPSA